MRRVRSINRNRVGQKGGDSQGEPDRMLPAKGKHAVHEGHLGPLHGSPEAKDREREEQEPNLQLATGIGLSLLAIILDHPARRRRLFLSFSRTSCIELTRSDIREPGEHRAQTNNTTFF